jgi:conjugative relaxase-like TrwC/TraI family protein
MARLDLITNRLTERRLSHKTLVQTGAQCAKERPEGAPWMNVVRLKISRIRTQDTSTIFFTWAVHRRLVYTLFSHYGLCLFLLCNLYIWYVREASPMLFITPSTDTKQAKDYFTRGLSQPDYYFADAPEVAGQWLGRGAELLGLSGTVDQERYFALCDNINPVTKEQLTPITRGNRRVLYDFTFDAPKSVSLAYELGGDERIMPALRKAVVDTMSEMEAAMMARVRAGGKFEDRATGNMVWAEFIHRTTRPVDGVPDPQLHCHAVAFNCTYDPVEDRFKAGEFSNLVANKGLYQAAFHSRLAQNLAALGYGIERDGNSFRLAGIDKTTAEKFSRRTEIIEQEAERLGITDAKAKGDLGRKTREGKDAAPAMSVPELRREWMKRLSDGERAAIVGARDGRRSTSPDATRAMDYALSHCFERASAVPERDVLKTALIQSVGAASVEDVRREMARENIIRRKHLGLGYVTTKEVLGEERAMTAFVREGRGRFRMLGGKYTPQLDAALSKEQREAAQTILTSRDRVTALRGGAGTGKTRMLQSTVKAIESAGKSVFAFAPSADAVSVLQTEGFANAATVERFLIDPEMQKRTRGQVLLVDESGLLSVKDMKRIFDVAAAQNARILLAGDSAQHHGVIRGDALRILERGAGLKVATLKEIRRQTDAQYREAVRAISEGDAPGRNAPTRFEDGVRMLDGMGAVIETTGENRYAQIAADYAAVTSERKGKDCKTALVVSPTHREADKVTAAIRGELKARGRVGKAEREFSVLRPLNFTEAQRKDARDYQPGQVVQFHQNARGFKRGERVTVVETAGQDVRVRNASGSNVDLPLSEAKKFQVYTTQTLPLAAGDKLRITMNGFTREGRRGLLGRSGYRLNNGSIYDVAGFTKSGDIRLTNGFTVQKDYGGLDHGFVVTSHASQGKTVDVSLIALGSESLAAANREQLYVSASRGREAVRLYTDDKASMFDAVKASAARLSASELVDVKPAPAKRPGLLQRLFQVQRIQRIYSAWREQGVERAPAQREAIERG